MAKISKRLISKHNKSLVLLEKEELDYYDREFIFDNYHEGVAKSNNMISAHFTPHQIALSMQQSFRNGDYFIDLCAGIGRLAYTLLRNHEMAYLLGDNKLLGICVENDQEYYKVGKKLLPQFHWICGDIFDPSVIEEIKNIVKTKQFSIISNPPYGKMVKSDTKELLKYSGNLFEYKAIELGAVLGASSGTFLLPQSSCPFRLSGSRKDVYNKSYKTSEYLKFVEQSGLEIEANSGFDTSIIEPEDGWKDVSIITEIAIVEYDELNYNPIPKKAEQISMF